jgi:hypothetical protein
MAMTMQRMVGMLAVMVLGAQVGGAQRVSAKVLGQAQVEGVGESPQTKSSVKDDLFAGTEMFAKGASDVTEITMDPDTLDMVGGNNKGNAHKMVLNVVRTYSYDKPGMYKMEDVETFRNKLNTGDWHCSVHVREMKTGESTDVCNKRRTDGLKETAIITVEPKSLTFIHTIRKDGDGGQSDVMLPMGLQMMGPQMMPMGPEWRANALVARAEMQADMAEMRANMAASGMYGGGFIKMQPMDMQSLQMLKMDRLKGMGNIDAKDLEKLKETATGIQLREHIDGWDAKGPVAPVPPAAPAVQPEPVPLPAPAPEPIPKVEPQL